MIPLAIFGLMHPLLAEADDVVALAPLTESTRGMFDAAAFTAMREGARFCNVGRGELVREDALLQALRSGHLDAAALDVFATEPLPADHPLWSCERVLVSPHMAGDTLGWERDLAELFLDNLRRWRGGADLRNVVDKHRGYVPVGTAGAGNVPADSEQQAAPPDQGQEST